MHEVGVHRPDLLVARARDTLEPFAIPNRDRAPYVTDQSSRLQGLGRERDARAGHTDHEGQELLLQEERVALNPVMRLQEPPGRALVDVVLRVAGSAQRG